MRRLYQDTVNSGILSLSTSSFLKEFSTADFADCTDKEKYPRSIRVLIGSSAALGNIRAPYETVGIKTATTYSIPEVAPDVTAVEQLPAGSCVLHPLEKRPLLHRKLKFKRIKQSGKTFLFRLSLPVLHGSIKLHLIVNDDLGDPHIHPWEFTSFLLFGAYREVVNGVVKNHPPLALVRHDRTKRHRVILYRLFGIKIPCLTIGRYTEKIQPWCEATTLCDRCKGNGYCVDKKYWTAKR